MGKAFFYLALSGWCVSAILHLMTFWGLREIGIWFYIVHASVVLIWLPVFARALRAQQTLARQNFNTDYRLRAYRVYYHSLNKQLLIIAVGCIIYCFISGIHTLYDTHHIPVTTPSGQEIHIDLSNELRLFSGVWMVFFAAATILLYPSGKAETALK